MRNIASKVDFRRARWRLSIRLLGRRPDCSSLILMTGFRNAARALPRPGFELPSQKTIKVILRPPPKHVCSATIKACPHFKTHFGCHTITRWLALPAVPHSLDETQTGCHARRPCVLVLVKTSLGHRRTEAGNNNGEDTELRRCTEEVHIVQKFIQRTLSTYSSELVSI
jgi:hypothetical protein